MRDKKKRIVDLKYLLMWNKLFLKEEVLNSCEFCYLRISDW